MRDELQHQKNLQLLLNQVIELMNKKEVLNTLVHKQEQNTPRQTLIQSLAERENLAHLRQKLGSLHPADIAFILENLPLKQRKMVWDLVKDQKGGAILLESSEVIRKNLISEMPHQEILDVAQRLESDEIADLLPYLPKESTLDVLTSLDKRNREQVQSLLGFPEGTVGALMDFDMITVREDVTFEVVLRYLHLRGHLSEQVTQLFVVDRTNILKGLLPIQELLVRSEDTLVKQSMIDQPIYFYTDDTAREAAQAFERYGLISAPVVNAHHELVGCLGVDMVMDFMHETTQKELLNQVGLQEEEDIFSPVWKSARNRWAWLGVNIIMAFIASRTIGLFENTIEQLVALAALMPIIANIGGNTGNQTIALIIRGLALNQIGTNNFRYLLFKEISIGLINGLLWGSVVGLFAYLLYQQPSLALVMVVSMILNLFVASLAGVFIPLTLHRLGRDPVIGSSVILTAITDSMGFFIFLGLATWLLL